MSAHAMSIVHRLVISLSVLSAVVIWFLVRGATELDTSQMILLVVFPGASFATAMYSVCMVFNCMGRR